MADTPTTQTTVAEPQKLTWDAPDGKHYEGSAEELFKISSERYNNLFPEYDKIKGEAAKAREQLEIVQQATRGQEPEPDKYNPQTYWSMMQADPLKAQQYLNRFDPEYQRAVVDLRATRQNQEAAIFKGAHPDFDAVNEVNIDKLTAMCGQLFGKQDVYTALQLDAAHALAFRQKESTTVSTTTVPPPPPPGTSGSITAPDYTKMTQPELAAYIQSLESQPR